MRLVNISRYQIQGYRTIQRREGEPSLTMYNPRVLDPGPVVTSEDMAHVVALLGIVWYFRGHSDAAGTGDRFGVEKGERGMLLYANEGDECLESLCAGALLGV